MFDWVAIESYTAIFYHVMLGATLLVVMQSLAVDYADKRSINSLSGLGVILLVFITLYMGLRPVSLKFGDMGSYGAMFKRYQFGEPLREDADILFERFMQFCAQVMSMENFFLTVDVLYLLPMYLFAQKHGRDYWFFMFFMFLASFSFWTYGTNGIRNGLGTSMFIMGLYYYNKRKLIMYGFFAAAFFMHRSTVIPIAAYIVTYFLLKRPRLILWIWLGAIPLSLAAGGFWEGLFGGFDFTADRSAGYIGEGSEEFMDQFSRTGFRWDFLFYSSFGILAGWYFIFKKKVRDVFYTHIFGIYAIGNAFWILIIRAAFSNRFAYLSWFLMAPVIIYPLCKYKVSKDQYKVVGAIIFIYYLFTYALFFK